MIITAALRCYKARTSKVLVQWSSVVSDAPGILNSITDSEIGVHLGSSQFRISFAWGMFWGRASLILGVSWSTQYVTSNLSPASSSQFTSLLPPPSLYGWLTDWLSLLRAQSSCISSNRQTMWWLSVRPSPQNTEQAGRHHRAPLDHTIRQLLTVTKCWEGFLLSDKKNISYDNGLILEAEKFLLDSLLFMPCLQFWTECSKWEMLKRR